MIMLWKNIKADFKKLKRTSIMYIHILIPIVGAFIFLLYYCFSNWNTNTKLIVYFETLTIVFPLLIGIITGVAVEQEEQAGNFQNMFCIVKSKIIPYYSKLIALLLLSIFSIIISTFTFAFGFKNYSLVFYLKLVVALFIGNIFLYILHLFISLRFGKGASVGLGIIGVLISALMSTGLGDGIWHIMPWAWAVRFCDLLIVTELNQLSITSILPAIMKGVLALIISILIGLIISILWFTGWEGRKSYD